MRELLHQDSELTIALEVGEEGATVVLESGSGGPDLSVEDEVVVAVNGEVCRLEVESPRLARAALPEPDEGDSGAIQLMIRVHEFFEGWEFFEEEPAS